MMCEPEPPVEPLPCRLTDNNTVANIVTLFSDDDIECIIDEIDPVDPDVEIIDPEDNNDDEAATYSPEFCDDTPTPGSPSRLCVKEQEPTTPSTEIQTVNVCEGKLFSK